MSDGIKPKKDFWDIIQALGPAIIAATVAVVGTMYNHQQAQIAKASEMREVYTKIMAERESSDNNIRANMFGMLFNAMFEKEAGLKGGPTNTRAIKQQVMFLDLLSRNFDTVDIKPLFEDLDIDFTKKVYNEQYPAEFRGDMFAMRSELRRIGKNLSIKQLNALASLAGSEVRSVVVMEMEDGSIQAIPDEPPQGKKDDFPVEVKPEQMQDGVIDLTLDYMKSKASDQGFKAPSFYITFYDLPYIDNSVLDKDMRVALVLTKFFNVSDLDYFRSRLDRRLVKDYQDMKDGGIRKYAEIRIVKFPAKYTGHRDRPYLQEILQDLVEDKSISSGDKAR
jgi:hypothetical protein